MSMLISVIFKIYVPVIISVTLLLFSFFVKKGQGVIEINPKFLGVTLFTYKPPLSNVWLVRTILLCSSVAIFSSLLFVDYSCFFPNNLQLQAFFDQDGISESLKVFSEDELKRLGIPDNYEQFQKRYYDDVNIVLRKILQKSKDTVFSRKDLYGKGECKLVVRKRAGIQKYYIEECDGKVKHALFKPNMSTVRFKTFFEKQDSRHDYLSPSLKDIFIKHAVIIQPRFRQIFSESSRVDNEIFDHILVSITKVHFFPYPRLSDSIYMIDYKGIGLVPIGYAIYR